MADPRETPDDPALDALLTLPGAAGAGPGADPDRPLAETDPAPPDDAPAPPDGPFALPPGVELVVEAEDAAHPYLQAFRTHVAAPATEGGARTAVVRTARLPLAALGVSAEAAAALGGHRHHLDTSEPRGVRAGAYFFGTLPPEETEAFFDATDETRAAIAAWRHHAAIEALLTVPEDWLPDAPAAAAP